MTAEYLSGALPDEAIEEGVLVESGVVDFEHDLSCLDRWARLYQPVFSSGTDLNSVDEARRFHIRIEDSGRFSGRPPTL